MSWLIRFIFIRNEEFFQEIIIISTIEDEKKCHPSRRKAMSSMKVQNQFSWRRFFLKKMLVFQKEFKHSYYIHYFIPFTCSEEKTNVLKRWTKVRRMFSKESKGMFSFLLHSWEKLEEIMSGRILSSTHFESKGICDECSQKWYPKEWVLFYDDILHIHIDPRVMKIYFHQNDFEGWLRLLASSHFLNIPIE